MKGENENTSSSAKKKVGVYAARMVPDGGVVGLGTGSTAAFTIQELGRRIKEENFKCLGVPTSYHAAILAREQGIPLITLDDVSAMDIAIDGADEVDPNKNLIKGGGAAHTREKIVDSLAKRFVVVVDESKLVEKLGKKWPVPIEVLSFAVNPVMRRLKEMGGEPQLRMGVKKDGPVISDEGNLIVDAKFPDISNPALLEKEINGIPGVLDNGIFAGLAHIILVAPLSQGEIKKME